MKTVSIIIPAYKEEKYIENALKGIIKIFNQKKFIFEIIVVVDKVNGDLTHKIVNDLSLEFIEIKPIIRNKKGGIASAIKIGIENATKEITIIAMGENSQDPNDLAEMALKMEDGYDMVFGNRFYNKQKLDQYPVKKAFLNFFCNLILKLLFGIKSRDITNGIKTYKTSILKNLKIESVGFEIFIELPIKSYISGKTNFYEIPFQYFGRSDQESKFSILKEGPKYIQLIWKCYKIKISNKF